jgi:formate dehydrogenase major subunit
MGLIPMFYPDYRPVTDPIVRAQFSALWGHADLDPNKGLTVVEIMHAALRKQVRGMYIMGENPAMSDPDVQHAREALAALDWLVVQDIFLTETAALADVVLPASAFPEKTGTFTNTDRRVQLGRTALPLPGETRQDLWISATGASHRSGLALPGRGRRVAGDPAGGTQQRRHHLGAAGWSTRSRIPAATRAIRGKR